MTRGIGGRILRLGEEPTNLQTTKRMMTQSNYDPVLGQYPARPPYAGNTVNPRASQNFMAEAKRRTAPEMLTGGRGLGRVASQTGKDPNDTVSANLMNYGQQGAAKMKTRTKLANQQSSGQGVVDTFKQMEEWSEDVYMPNPPITRFDGSGRTVSPRKRMTYNRILQMESNPEDEEKLKQKEKMERDALVKRRLATGYLRQANYNIVSIRNRDTGEELLTPEQINRGVKHVSATASSSGAVGSLLGASLPKVAGAASRGL